MPLTELEIKNAKPKERPYKLTDGGWLFLLVNPNGSKLWRLSYRFSGKHKLLALGAYPSVGLKDAGSKRDGARAMLADGIDTDEQRRLTKLTRETQTATTFMLIAAEYRDKLKREGRAPATLDKLDWLLALVEPKLGGRPISEITAPEALAALKPVEARGNLETARRSRSTIGSVFRYAIATARATNDPTGALKGALVAPKAKYRAAITDPLALGTFLRVLDGFDGQPETHAALKLPPLVFLPGPANCGRPNG